MLKTLLTIGACVRTPFSIIMQQQSATPTPLAEGGAALLTADAISLSYAESFIFKDISFAIARGAKLALVGANGAGKSSLLKVLCGKLQPDTGSVDIARGVRSAYVEQEPSLPPGAPAADFIFSSDAPFARALAEYRAAVQAVDNGESDASERVGSTTTARRRRTTRGNRQCTIGSA
jgi:ATPase subunit of ABC transporter with duplicated ATPase domains